MPRFNTPTATVTRTTNLAGGEAFIESPALELASMVLTSMLTDQAYRKGEATMARLVELVSADPLFAAKAAVYARHEAGMRSVSHVVAGEVAMRVKGEQWTRPFFRSVVRRPDDVTEILSYVIASHGRRPLPNALKDGLGQALGKFDSYALGKYRAEGKAMSLVDAVNLLHPKPTEKNAEALKALVAGTLTSTDTWEAMISEAGHAEDEEAVAEAKSEAWGDLVKSRKIGYFALLRNLRNILAQADAETKEAALEMLADETLIRKSLVLPFRFYTAAQAMASVPDSRSTIEAISKATDISLGNVPHFDGKTLIVVDASGSMTSASVGRGKTLVADVAALFASVLYRVNDADLMLFSTTAAYAQVDPSGSTLGIAQAIRQHMAGGGTNFRSIFETAARPYERVIILSDMQGWIGHDAPTDTFTAYKTRVSANPKVYTFDLAGYGTTQFPEQDVFCLAGFSDRVFEVMATLDQDRHALVDRINAVEFA